LSDKNITPQGIVLKGYASPEGSYASNDRLSENRVKALCDYIRRQHNFKEDFFVLDNEPEDWDGFKVKTEADANIPDRDAVLEIINSSDEPDRKESDLRSLNGGVAYRYVLENIFPSLRRSEYRINYIVRSFSVEEGREVIKTHPEQLSLSEMFAVANSYPVASDEYNSVFDIAVRLYPEDEIANLNAANIAMGKGDYSSARHYLSKAGETPEAIHARGVLNLLEGNLEEALVLLKKAKEMGVSEAASNLDELERKNADNALFDSFN
jgi:tetratricopeptide (TPR) repeat protein